MKVKSALMFLILAVFSVLLHAEPPMTQPQPVQEKMLHPGWADARICNTGEALTYTIQCDPGTRPGVDRVWNPMGQGYEVCRVTGVSCAPIPQFNPNARPGFEVLDSPGAGSRAMVVFGLGVVEGQEPF